MRVDEFDFPLPDEQIAQHPPAVRGTSRLMVLDRATGATTLGTVDDLPAHFRAGDVLVVNDTRVFPARLLGHRLPGGGRLECLLVERLRARGSGLDEERLRAQGSGLEERLTAQGSGLREHSEGDLWEALVHPGQRLKVGSQFVIDAGGSRHQGGGNNGGAGGVIHGEIVGRGSHGKRTVRLRAEGFADVDTAIEALGHMPLPPYIKRPDASDDRERYQTVYGTQRGSVAAPTAGLHFTPGMLERLQAMGVEIVRVTLHVGYGTFKPVRVELVEDHVVDPERYDISEAAADAINRAKADGRRVVVVGTTSTRALESAVGEDGRVRAGAATTSLYIRPGHRFRVVDALMTNFHVPRSSLLFLVCAFAGHRRVMDAYARAVAEGFRFYSYGDAMLIV
ncbi:S-adenosylmethionine:tRNA ribosyltransferase-isomerase [Luteitalea sp. TBR-22]|uniref:tRNA preQ1(34) S-adenosylmethionine ribosyltransferase-isomerase QueA n=1 Tax=Luteitalea sp. TBR-22 TaxID=2802971 RepID=UPI001AF9C912|nr:tRNA preQ1(34) S-adenosylmethionine ribosyltransferase-isomerase QueA [Luteitalea sp. TBR-22]BCS31364.1 S-adenosylmethionine:tRNA ribosyltransferase-isomerase [Luteitalea sp. TBR-22]